MAARKDSSKFSTDDEETLVMITSQAILTISTARRYRGEPRARSDLETLINAAPERVGVMDTKAGTPVFFNREASRTVERLRDSNQSSERLVETNKVRRAEGLEVPEVPLEQALKEAETVHAKENVKGIPGGYSVTVLFNATPIFSEDGEVSSFVVTLQDMMRLEEQERLGVEFPAKASHDLRMPLSFIKGSTTAGLREPSSLQLAGMTQTFRIVDLQADGFLDLVRGLLDVASVETGTLSVDPRHTEVTGLGEEAARAIASTDRRFCLRIDKTAGLPRGVAYRGRTVQVLDDLISKAARHSLIGVSIRVTAEREVL